MGKSKKYVYDYEQFENGKGPGTMVADILNDPEFSQVSDLVIGCWGGILGRQLPDHPGSDRGEQGTVFPC